MISHKNHSASYFSQFPYKGSLIKYNSSGSVWHHNFNKAKMSYSLRKFPMVLILREGLKNSYSVN